MSPKIWSVCRTLTLISMPPMFLRVMCIYATMRRFIWLNGLSKLSYEERLASLNCESFYIADVLSVT